VKICPEWTILTRPVGREPQGASLRIGFDLRRTSIRLRQMENVELASVTSRQA
jgi:hypothetical protein